MTNFNCSTLKPLNKVHQAGYGKRELGEFDYERKLYFSDG